MKLYQPSVSVVVPTYNKKEYLQRCLESLLVLNYPEYEIIVVDDGSTDGTKNYLQQVKNSQIKTISHEKNLGTCVARNNGISIAQYGIVAFIDDDCVADVNWLKNIVLGFDKENIGFVIGETIYVEKGYRGYFPERLVQNLNAEWPMGCNMAYRKQVLKEAGGFDPTMFVYGNEDTELALNVLSRGWNFERRQEAMVFHQAIDWTVRTLKRGARYASVWPILKKRYPKIYRHFGSDILFGFIVLPWHYLYILLFPVTFPFLLFKYMLNGKRGLRMFFAKWPIYMIMQRYYIYKESIRHNVWMI